MSSSNNKKDNLDPFISPAKAEMKKHKTRRLTKFPMYVAGGIGLLVILILVVVGAGKGNQSVESEEQVSERSVSHQRSAESLIRDIGSPKPIKKAEEPKEIVIKNKEPIKRVESLEDINKALADIDGFDGEYYPEPTTLTPPSTTSSMEEVPVDSDLEIIKQMKVDAFMKAMNSKTEVASNLGGGGNNSSAVGEDYVTRSVMNGGITDGDEYLRMRSSQYNNSSDSLGASANSGFGGLFGGGMNGSSSLVSNTGTDWKLNSELEKGSQYQLRTGTIIPSMLLTEINSDLAGVIQGQVSQNVYDTVTGKHLLVPQGTRLIGQYDSDIVYGQSRVLIVWNRMIFPNGYSLDIGEMPGADSMGKSGLQDKVNNHYGKMFINALLMSGITGVVSYTQDKNNNSNNDNNKTSMSDSMAQALGQQFGQVTMEMIRKNMNVSPTLEIRAGFRFNIIVTKDIDFPGAYHQ